MPNEGHPFGPSTPDSNDEIDELFAVANPNPNRVGCPSRDVLESLANRNAPIDAPGYEHLRQCSPCYQEFRRLQRHSNPGKSGRSRVLVRALVAAAAVGVVLCAWLLMRTKAEDLPVRASIEHAPPVQKPVLPPPELRAVLDLREFTVSRGAAAAPRPKALTLERGLVNVTIQLPIGAEDGRYGVQLLDSEHRPVVTSTGEAGLRNYVTTFDVRLDLAVLKPGNYQLAVRRENEGWRLYPVEVE